MLHYFYYEGRDKKYQHELSGLTALKNLVSILVTHDNTEIASARVITCFHWIALKPESHTCARVHLRFLFFLQVTTSKLLSITNFLLLWNGKYSSVLKKLYRTNLITHACIHSSHQLNIFWLLQTFLHKAPDSFKLDSTGRNGSLWCDVGSLSFMWEVLGNSRKSWENQKKCQNIRSVRESGKDSGN